MSDKKETLYENDMYTVSVGKSVMTDADDLSVYLVVNKDTGVVEHEGTVLASAVAKAYDFQEMMRALEKRLDDRHNLENDGIYAIGGEEKYAH